MESNFNETPKPNDGNGFNNVPQLPPKNYLVESILMTVLCCLPFGIVALLSATKVEGLFRSGDIEGAQNAADQAKKYCKWGLICGIVGWVVWIILYVAVIGATIASGNY